MEVELRRIGAAPLVHALCLLVASAPALRADEPPAAGKAAFSATATAGSKLEGKSAALAAAWEGETLVVTLPLASFQTGIDLRDKHLRNHLEADKYPVAELRVPLAALQLPAAGAPTSGAGQAPLSFHGVVKPVSFTWKATRGAGLDVAGALQLDFREFGVPVPSYLGVSVRPLVDVAVEFHVAEPRPAAAPAAAAGTSR